MEHKIKSAIYGTLIADAFAMPYEFKSEHALRSLPLIDMVPSSGQAKSHQAKAGTYSDEGAMVLAMMDSISMMHGFKAEDYFNRLVAYYNQGEYAYKNETFGYSLHFKKTMDAYKENGQIFHMNQKDEYEDCGSLVRVLPAMIFDYKNDGKSTIKICHKQALLTYGNIRYGICSAIYGQWIKNIIKGDKNPFVNGIRELMDLYNDDVKKIIVDEMLNRSTKKQGYLVIDCLMNAYDIISHTSTYKSAIQEATLRGGQTTALASVVGSVAGLMYGYQNIPSLWIDILRNKENIDMYINNFSKEIRGE